MRAFSLARAGARKEMARLVESARFEIFPTPTILDGVLAHVEKDVTVTVTTSPRKGLEASLELALSLSKEGYRVVPHLSARLLRDGAHVREVAARLRAAGIEDVFVPAGDADPPAGTFESALPVLEELSRLEDRFERVGITGYPESHPQISDDVTIQSMWDKRRYADYIVSNLCFDAAVLRRWVRRVRARGVTLPLYVGLAGPSEPGRLLDMARRIGVAESARFAGRHAGWMARLSASPGGYRPDRLLERTSAVLSDPASLVEGIHVFTFNQIAEAAAWRKAVVASAASLAR